MIDETGRLDKFVAYFAPVERPFQIADPSYTPVVPMYWCDKGRRWAPDEVDTLYACVAVAVQMPRGEEANIMGC